MESHCYIHHKSCTCHRIDICSALSRWMCKGEHSSSSCLQFASHIYHGYPICHRSWWSHTLNCYPYAFQKPSCHISTGFHRSTANFLTYFLCMLQSKLREALKDGILIFFYKKEFPFSYSSGKMSDLTTSPIPPSGKIPFFYECFPKSVTSRAKNMFVFLSGIEASIPPNRSLHIFSAVSCDFRSGLSNEFCISM